MKSPTNIAILISVIIFFISLTQVCMIYQYFGIVNYPSYLAVLVGWMHFGIGGFWKAVFGWRTLFILLVYFCYTRKIIGLFFHLSVIPF